MKNIFKIGILWLCTIGMLSTSNAQKLEAETFAGLEFRNLGPALTSGRIADIAIHPENESIWYVAVGSGGVWKTVNSGTTWTPIFDKQKSYSIGCLTIDRNNPHTIWVGTGENVGGRHVGFGDGIYVSYDDGKTWKNKGLTKSEHISKIVVHPENSNEIIVAVQGPLWNKGGERGVYKSIDGGETWKKVLGGNEWTGATDLVMDTRDPKVLYAATWQRHRTVAAYLGSGPDSGIHKSTDGGETWQKLTEGIPKVNLGKIGLAISPFDNETIYAAIEMERITGGLFISKNSGLSWTKQSDVISGATGPHYYQEIFASPHQEGRLYFMNNVVKISDDHGKTFYNMNEKNKHVDSHAVAFKKSDPNYILFGTDGGLYETFDLTKSWRFVRNLPVTQYYKLAVDDATPFYHIYGGTQDNGTHGGPSRTRSSAGINSSDWWISLGADGHQPATEPGNPNITYGEFQEGVLWRIDQTTRETVYIKPQARLGDPLDRFNWDAPILVSSHNPKRLYFASQRVWKSENRGDEWKPISGDLTRNQERMALPIMGKQQSWDNAWDVGAMSNYNTITSLAESPKQDGLLYVGTDDGIIQVSENAGESWKKIEVGNISGIPKTAFVNDIRADLFDANTVYAALDNHKYGDFRPYLIKSTNRGKSWKSISGDLPERLLVWRLVQDHEKSNLLFLATEFGIYFSNNAGKNWIALKGGIPTISFRDITIQRRENDLVAASFGRGFFVLDDITPIRTFDQDMLESEASLFEVKPAYWYVENRGVYGRGDAEFTAKNPPYGAVFTYFMPDKLKSLKELRQEREKELIKKDAEIQFVGWDALETEKNQKTPEILLIVADEDGNLVNTVKGKNKKGFNRVSWKLDYPNRSGEKLRAPKKQDDYVRTRILATPGNYNVSLYKRLDGKLTKLSGPKSFEVMPLMKGALDGSNYEEMNAFRNKYEEFRQDLRATSSVGEKCILLTDAMSRALDKAEKTDAGLNNRIFNLKQELLAIKRTLVGYGSKSEIGEKSEITPGNASNVGRLALGTSTYGPTATHKAELERATKQLNSIKANLKTLFEETIPQIEKDLKSVNAPWIEGQGLIKD